MGDSRASKNLIYSGNPAKVRLQCQKQERNSLI